MSNPSEPLLEASQLQQPTAAPLHADQLQQDENNKSVSCSPETQRQRAALAKQAEHLEAKRKLSQSSSQVSTDFVSTSLAESSRRSSSIGQCNLLLRKNLTASRLQIEMSPLFGEHQQRAQLHCKQNGASPGAANSKTNGKRGSTGLHRTVSQSMIELDQSLPPEAKFFQVSWSSLSFEYKPSLLNKYLKPTSAAPSQRLVLNDLCGSFHSNQLIAIIGPSGCGKTTFLQFLAGNNSESAERLRIAGLREPKVAFIGQDDALLAGLTAKETLVYASRLQNQTRGAAFDHEQHVLPILTELGLLECANRNVSKLSGGQAKRVTIAQELLYPTNLLILDEVTSGLDASTSYSIVKLLKYLVSDQTYPMSIVMSIHQPSARLFSVFDRVYLMSEGSCLYEGGCHIDLVNEYLGQFALECPRFHNIADYLIEVASDESLEPVRHQMIAYQRKQRDQTRLASVATQTAKEPQHCYLQFDDREADAGSTLTGSSSAGLAPERADASLYEAIQRARLRRPRPFGPQFAVHLQRSLLRIRRSYILTYLQLVTYIVLGLQLATFYGPDIGRLGGCPRLPGNLMSLVLATSSSTPTAAGDPASAEPEPPDQLEEQALEMRRIQENMNFLLVVVMTATFAALEITVITFPMEAKTIKREWRNGWYRTSSYFMGRTLADLPFSLAFVVLFCAIVFIMTGQFGLGTWRFGSFVLVLVMTALVAQSFGFIFGALFMDNLPAAVFSAPLCIFPTLLFSGFFARVSQIPQLYRPMTYFSHFRYAFDALLVTLYGYGRCECDEESLERYHANLPNQTETMREMFRYLFGSSDCPGPDQSARLLPESAALLAAEPAVGATNQTGLINAQDLAAIGLANRTVADTIGQLTGAQLATAAPLDSLTTRHEAAISSQLGEQLKSFEDALVERMFNHMLAANSSGRANSSSLVDAAAATTMPSFLQDAPSSPQQQQDQFANGITSHLAHEFGSKVTTMLNRQSNFGHAFPKQCDNFKSYLLTEFDLQNADLLTGLWTLFLIVLVTRLICCLMLNFSISTRAK